MQRRLAALPYPQPISALGRGQIWDEALYRKKGGVRLTLRLVSLRNETWTRCQGLCLSRAKSSQEVTVWPFTFSSPQSPLFFQTVSVIFTGTVGGGGADPSESESGLKSLVLCEWARTCQSEARSLVNGGCDVTSKRGVNNTDGCGLVCFVVTYNTNLSLVYFTQTFFCHISVMFPSVYFY